MISQKIQVQQQMWPYIFVAHLVPEDQLEAQVVFGHFSVVDQTFF